VRPWQHVLEPLGAYLLLAERMADGIDFCEAWNFGPEENDACSVEELVKAIVAAWGSGSWVAGPTSQPHEAATLRLCTDKAYERLGWKPRWSLAMAVDKTVEWYKEQMSGADALRLRALSSEQIAAYVRD
jgi:CDP-glucose 4,6-dehydratase